MATSIIQLAPFIPSDTALAKSKLLDNALQLNIDSAKLAGQLSPLSLATLERYMMVINSYYSNLIEGNATRPHEIRAAQRGDYDGDPVKRDLQLESTAHIAVQQWISEQSLDLDTIFSTDFILELHRRFYSLIPESLWMIKDETGHEVDKVKPGSWRTSGVKVGRHIAPEPDELQELMLSFCNTYHPKVFSSSTKLLGIMAAHHRFSWIHPFADGNGRVGRLLTDAALKTAGLDSYGVWCLSRGLAKSSVRYKGLLAAADEPRQGDYDGRGSLTEKGLLEFCEYMVDTSLDQVTYMSQLLDLSDLRKRMDAYVQARNDFRVSGMTEALKPSAARVLHHAFVLGELKRAEAVDLCGMPERSARRLLSQLKTEGLLSETSSRSPLRWEIPEHAEAWYFPNLAPFS